VRREALPRPFGDAARERHEEPFAVRLLGLVVASRAGTAVEAREPQLAQHRAGAVAGRMVHARARRVEQDCARLHRSGYRGVISAGGQRLVEAPDRVEDVAAHEPVRGCGTAASNLAFLVEVALEIEERPQAGP
jgi:hypothetical protein